MEIYVVQSGDTVFSIAERFGVSRERIISDNALSSSGELTEGQALLILRPETVYTFQRGDTLFSVAETYGTTVMQLYRNNPFLIGSDIIPEGTQIAVRFETEPTMEIQTSGFAYSHIRQNVLEAALPYLTHIIIFGYGFEENGDIIEVNDERIIETSHEYRTSVLLSLTTINRDGTFGSGKIERLLTDFDFQNTIIQKMIEVIKRKNAQGMDIDMEYIPPRFRTEFAAFISNAARQLEEAGLESHVDLAPKTSAEQKGTLYEAHDYGLLGDAADMVFLMTYEWGYTYGPPMAVAPLPNVRRVLEYALEEIPADKIFLGIPNYGYNWKLPYVQGESKAVTLGNVTAVNLAIEKGSEILYDETAQSPYFYYTDPEGIERVVWFEDVRSISAKFGLVSESGIRGCGYWNLMRPFPQNYLLLNGTFRIAKVYGE